MISNVYPGRFARDRVEAHNISRRIKNDKRHKSKIAMANLTAAPPLTPAIGSRCALPKPPTSAWEGSA